MSIRSPKTRDACAKAAGEFAAWCGLIGLPEVGAIVPCGADGLYLRPGRKSIGMRVEDLGMRKGGRSSIRLNERRGKCARCLATTSRTLPTAQWSS